MTLNPHPTYPAAGAYVIRMHRDARPESGQLVGRAEHVASGESTDFATAQDLLAWLIQHATGTHRALP